MGRNRDDFLNKTKVLLAQRTSYLCSNPECRRLTMGANSESGKITNIGVAAHICAASPGGPRFDPEMSPNERASENNGIWLCQSCSVLVDKESQKYTVDLLHYWKKLAEQRSHNMVNSPYLFDSLLVSEDISNEEMDEWNSSFFDTMEENDSIGELLNDIVALLSACRRTLSWDDRSELKLYQWLNCHSENELSELHKEELLEIRESVRSYLELHFSMDEKIQKDVPRKVSLIDLFRFIELHPSSTDIDIASGLGADLPEVKDELDILFEHRCIAKIKSESRNIDACKWIKNYGNDNAHFRYVNSII